jgi:galactose-1-phosphate uridylyltransferase
MTKKLSSMVSASMEKKLKNYENVAKEFNKFFDQEELGKTLNSKSDRLEVKELLSNKASN